MKARKLGILSVVIALLFASLAVVSAQDNVRITFWSNEFQPERVERQREIIDAFEAANPGVEVELVVADENLMDQLMTLNVAAGTPPDVVLHPLQLSAKWYASGLLYQFGYATPYNYAASGKLSIASQIQRQPAILRIISGCCCQ